MRFVATALPGVQHIIATPQHDARGSFARLFCPQELAAAGVTLPDPFQISLSRNPSVHTLRGMHFQPPPYAETKLVRAVRGRAYDVVIDLRPDSPRYLGWIAIELDAEAMNAVFIPPGCAHGFMTLQPDTDLLYQISPPHVPDRATGVRWDDPGVGIAWPVPPALLDARDAGWPDWQGRPYAAIACAKR